jgi:hypothetical protein
MKDYNKLSKDELMDELILLGDENLILTKLNNKLNKQFSLQGVSHRRELFTDLLIWYKYNVGKDNLKNCEELAEEYINL